ncbi:anaerobic ribonucleoside-triphosphate reductase activating protein [Sporolactobacillus vineae]|uniref:anaerobic ribonucleoside-triphosphate reductase activating protein n=1 Tax=Sporolactobacillus vineae TaxID=444463 RepID=UPI000289C633|nr:anaerobic ribonucleoside-triphosphate reductase activating protein [Sporolactobacillus vineae]
MQALVHSATKMRIMQIYRDSVADGLGLRTVIFFAGCGQDPKCPLCQNPEAWSAGAGKELPMDTLICLATATKNNEITFSGGDPLTFQFPYALEAARILKTRFHKNIWLYTGYRWEFIRKSAILSQILPYIDVLVDGRFVNRLRDISLKFRGSSNQRIIDVPASLKENRVIDLTDQIE